MMAIQTVQPEWFHTGWLAVLNISHASQLKQLFKREVHYV
jgi:hypothetical protein